MNTDDLTIREAKELAGLFGDSKRSIHPMNGHRVVAVLPHGFIHFGTLIDDGARYMLKHASNLRSWTSRAGGLPEFAKSGPVNGDRIDEIGTVYIETIIFVYPCGDWND